MDNISARISQVVNTIGAAVKSVDTAADKLNMPDAAKVKAELAAKPTRMDGVLESMKAVLKPVLGVGGVALGTVGCIALAPIALPASALGAKFGGDRGRMIGLGLGSLGGAVLAAYGLSLLKSAAGSAGVKTEQKQAEVKKQKTEVKEQKTEVKEQKADVNKPEVKERKAEVKEQKVGPEVKEEKKPEVKEAQVEGPPAEVSADKVQPKTVSESKAPLQNKLEEKQARLEKFENLQNQIAEKINNTPLQQEKIATTRDSNGKLQLAPKQPFQEKLYWQGVQKDVEHQIKGFKSEIEGLKKEIELKVKEEQIGKLEKFLVGKNEDHPDFARVSAAIEQGKKEVQGLKADIQKLGQERKTPQTPTFLGGLQGWVANNPDLGGPATRTLLNTTIPNKMNELKAQSAKTESPVYEFDYYEKKDLLKNLQARKKELTESINKLQDEPLFVQRGQNGKYETAIQQAFQKKMHQQWELKALESEIAALEKQLDPIKPPRLKALSREEELQQLEEKTNLMASLLVEYDKIEEELNNEPLIRQGVASVSVDERGVHHKTGMVHISPDGNIPPGYVMLEKQQQIRMKLVKLTRDIHHANDILANERNQGVRAQKAQEEETTAAASRKAKVEAMRSGYQQQQVAKGPVAFKPNEVIKNDNSRIENKLNGLIAMVVNNDNYQSTKNEKLDLLNADLNKVNKDIPEQEKKLDTAKQELTSLNNRKAELEATIDKAQVDHEKKIREGLSGTGLAESRAEIEANKKKLDSLKTDIETKEKSINNTVTVLNDKYAEREALGKALIAVENRFKNP